MVLVSGLSPDVVTNGGHGWGHQKSEFTEDSSELLAGRFQSAFGPEHKVGTGHFLFHRQLRSDALLNLFRRPSAGLKSLLLGSGGAGDTDDLIKGAFGLRLVKQGNHHDAQRDIFRAPLLGEGLPAFTDAGVKDGFELLAGGGVRKNAASQFRAAQRTISREDAGTKGFFNFGQGGLTGLDEVARQVVGVHDARAGLQQKTGGGGFSHPHAAGQTAEFHWNQGVTTAR